MRVRHPYALDDDAPAVDDRVHWGGRRDWSDVDDDGTFYVPDDRARDFVERWPEADGYEAADLLIAENGESGDSGEGSTEATDGSDGDGIEEVDKVTFDIDRGVCPWCDDYDGDHVGQHASSAHPDEWDAHKEADDG